MHKLVATVTALIIVAASATAASAHPPRVGVRLGSISIPRIGLLDVPLTEGGWDLYTAAWPPELSGGPAHYRNTPLPWQPGTSAFAGHRTTFTHPFLLLNEVRRGDPITLRTAHGVFVYHVTHMRIVTPDDLAILRAPRVGHRLLLTACHPPHLATFRLAVWATR